MAPNQLNFSHFHFHIILELYFSHQLHTSYIFRIAPCRPNQENTITHYENKITHYKNTITHDENTITHDENTITQYENTLILLPIYLRNVLSILQIIQGSMYYTWFYILYNVLRIIQVSTNYTRLSTYYTTFYVLCNVLHIIYNILWPQIN
jgi:hypothetical protein